MNGSKLKSSSGTEIELISGKYRHERPKPITRLELKLRAYLGSHSPRLLVE